MNNYFVPVKSVFKNKFINVLDIESGLEFLVDDILIVINIAKNTNAQAFNLIESLSTTRIVLIDGSLCERQSLNWLALKHLFDDFNYQDKTEFSRWIRKSLKPALALKKSDDYSKEKICGINLLSWYFGDADKSVESLVSVYQSHLVKFLNAFHVNDLQNNNSVAYNTYLKLLKKEVDIPEYQILETSDLGSRLLRQRYLESALIILGVNNVRYFNFFDTFIYKRNDLLTAQELDIAILFALKKGTIPYLMLEVIEGGFFLQCLLACTLNGAIDKSLSLQIKQAYIRWLNDIYLAK